MSPRSRVVRRMAATAMPAILVLMLAAGCGASSDRPTAQHSPTDKASATRSPGSPANAPAMAYVDQVSGAMEEITADVASVSGGATATAAPRIRSRMLIRNVSMLLVVGSVDSASTRIERLVRQHGGFIESSSAENRGGNPLHTFRLRVPGEAVDAMVADLRSMSVRVERESQGVQDVTDQVVDVEARLRTLRATETELLGLLKDARARGQKTQDIMAVYRELTGIRTQIEQFEGQLQSLKDLAALSTISVELTPDAAASPIQPQVWRPSETIKTSLRQLVGALRGLSDFAIWTAIVLIPLGGIVAGIIALIVVGLRRAPTLVRRQG